MSVGRGDAGSPPADPRPGCDLCHPGTSLMYTVMYMVRMQIYLTETQRKLLARKARGLGLPVAVLIRRAIDRYLGGGGTETDPKDVLRRTLGALPNLEVPERREWDRSFAAEDRPTYG